MSREVDLGQIVPNIQVGTTTTGLPSTPASVENVGTDLNPIFNFTIPKGNTGATPNIQIGDVQTGDSSEVTRTGTDENPILNFTLEKGDTGNGIASIAKTSTSGLVDTYTITFTNGQTTTFEVTNGANGDVVDVQVDGTSVVDDGVANIILADIKQELEDMYNLLPKVSGTGETITLDGTVAGKMLIDLKGNTSQEGTPTPETPQDIHVVSGDNSINVCGKNLLNIYGTQVKRTNASYSNISVSNNTLSYSITTNVAGYIGFVIPIEIGKQYTLSYSNLIGTGNGNLIYSIELDNVITEVGTNYGAPRTSGYSFTATKPYIGVWLSVTTNGGSTGSVSNLMLEKGNQATTYTPYESNSYPINLGDIELCKIGDYQDYFYKDNGKWYLRKAIGKKVLNGSEIWTYYTDTNKPVFYIDTTIMVNKIDYLQENGLTCFSNYYQGKGQVNTFNDVYAYGNNVIAFRITYKRLVIRDDRFTDINDFYTWIRANNIILTYVLETPTNEEITDSTLLSQLETVKRSYEGQTNISQESNDLPFIINATALKEMA